MEGCKEAKEMAVSRLTPRGAPVTAPVGSGQAPCARSCGVRGLLFADIMSAAVSWGVCKYKLNKVKRRGVRRDEGPSEVLGSFPSSAFCGQKEGQGRGGSEGQQGRKIGWEVLPRPRLGEKKNKGSEGYKERKNCFVICCWQNVIG